MKSKTHVYMADLILKDLHDGVFVLPGVGKYTVPQDVADALLNWPGAFRAGAVGPDFYPDMLMGQSIIHPENSGKWITYLFEQYGALPDNHPEKQKVYAFILGFMMHYSGDLYGHYYVNNWARGWFQLDPELEKMRIIARHILVETYMDHKVPDSIDLQLDAPIDFVKECFMSTAVTPDYKKASFTMPMDAFMQLENAILSCSSNSSVNMIDVASYFSGWCDDIDNGVFAWLNSWQQIASILTDPKRSMSDAKDVLEFWASNHLALMFGIPHWAEKLTNLIAEAIDALNILKPLKDEIKKMLFEYMKSFVMAIAGEAVETVEEAIEMIEKFSKDPATYLNSGFLYPERNITDQLDAEMGNYGQSSDTTSQTFHAFYQCLNMCKLCLVGPENLNKITAQFNPDINNFYRRPVYDAGVRNLKIIIKTQNNKWSFNPDDYTCGTDDNVYFALLMKDGSCYETLLDTPRHNDFESGQTDRFTFTLPQTIHLSDIRKIQLRKDYIKVSDDWKPAWIKLADDAGNEFFSASIHHMLKGREKFTIDASIPKVTHEVSIDPKIISFLYSLDGAGEHDHQANPTQELPWDRQGFPFYADLMLRKTVYQKLFEASQPPEKVTWVKKANVAQYKGADWKNHVKTVSDISLEEAMKMGEESSEIKFFFYLRNGMMLEGKSGEWTAKGTFKPRDAVFFSGTPWYGSAPQADAYEKETFASE